ncbi:MAG: hypothetical protein PHW33_00045 [Candidatus Portnoybacteria bacterium]|jgi:hypothetical protein|nr:hypothetical protein [Candidatus Portnoybacteria bacterium]
MEGRKIVIGNERLVVAAGLGLCEHCGTLMTLEDMPAEAIDADWACPACGKIISSKTFGYEGKGADCRRTKWVGPDRQWVEEKPKQEFVIGFWRVIPEAIRPYPLC